MKDKIREMSVLLLDDPHGINEEAFLCLKEILHETDNMDVITKVESMEGRFFLNEADAKPFYAEFQLEKGVD